MFAAAAAVVLLLTLGGNCRPQQSATAALQPLGNPSPCLPCLLRCSYVQEFDEKNPATYKGLNLYTMPMSALYAHFGLDAQTIDFIGHALALHRCDARGWGRVRPSLLVY